MEDAKSKPWEAQEIVYVSQNEWIDDHEHTLFVGCSEPTMRPLFEEFAQEYLHLHRYTRILKGGGAGTVALTYPYFFATQSEIAELHSLHKFTRIVGLVHWRCGYYHSRHPKLEETELFSLQKKDLHNFRSGVQKIVPGVRVELYYAYPKEQHLHFACIE